MATDDPKNDGLMAKALDVIEQFLDNRLEKSSAGINPEPDFAGSEDILYRKSAYRDPSYSIGALGYGEKTVRLSFQLLREMARRDTIVAAILQNYQNDMSDFAKKAKARYDKGFKICPKNERERVAEIIEELFGAQAEGDEAQPENKDFNKADISDTPFDPGTDSKDDAQKDEKQKAVAQDRLLNDREKDRIAREELAKRCAKDIEHIEQMLMSCGSMEDRSFEDRRWNFEGFMRAIIRDSLSYDQYAVERIYDEEGKLHHWVPVDAGTVRFATPALKQHGTALPSEMIPDILYPEKEMAALEEGDAFKLDEQKLKDDEYRWVQVIRGKIERAFTEKELCVGMRNPTTDVYANGYSIPELELLMNTVSSHIFTENYNRLYFTQGFSAKGILHIKAPLPRRKLEAFRIQWNHLIKGNRNSFQTPIVSGMEDIQWVPLTQSHSDMEFANWMNYLIKIVCSMYQIDPIEIGFGMKEEGRTGGGLSGDNSKEKIRFSKEKGLKPLVTHVQTFLNQYIVNQIDEDYELVFVGLDDETQKDAIDRQKEEVKFKKTINEIRAEDGLPPLEGCDRLILDPTYMSWYTQMSDDGLKAQKEKNDQQMQAQSLQEGSMIDPKTADKLEEKPEEGKEEASSGEEPPKEESAPEQEVQKSILIEHYTFPKE